MTSRLKPREVAAYRKRLLAKQHGLCALCKLPIEPGQDTLDHCFPGHVEILTERGFVHFRALGPSTKVAQWHDGEISLTAPLDRIEYDYHGELVRLEKKSFSIECTPEHQVVLVDKRTGATRKVNAAVVPTGETREARQCVIPKAGQYVGGAGIALSDDEIRLYVAFQADGCFTTGARFRLRREDKINRLTGLLERLGITYQLHNTDAFQVYIGKAAIPGYLTKRFNLPLWDFTQHQLRVFVEELEYWDASRLGRSVQYSCTDEHNTEYVQLAYTLAGYRGTSWTRNGSGRRPLHYAQFTRPIKGDSNRALRRTFRTYKARVYCVTVPSGAIIVRHEGHISVMGNCHSTGHCRGVLHRNCNQGEGRIKQWASRQYCSPAEFLQAILDYWAQDYSHYAVHPNHRTPAEREVQKLKRRMKKLKTARGKQRYLDRIKALEGGE